MCFSKNMSTSNTKSIFTHRMTQVTGYITYVIKTLWKVLNDTPLTLSLTHSHCQCFATHKGPTWNDRHKWHETQMGPRKCPCFTRPCCLGPCAHRAALSQEERLVILRPLTQRGMYVRKGLELFPRTEIHMDFSCKTTVKLIFETQINLDQKETRTRSRWRKHWAMLYCPRFLELTSARASRPSSWRQQGKSSLTE